LGSFMDLAYSTPVGCAEVTDRYTNAQAKGSVMDPVGFSAKCAPGEKALTAGTAEFLDLAEDGQNQVLNFGSDKCSFYKDWYREVFETQPTKLVCNGNNADATIQYYQDGEEKTVSVHYGFDSSGVKTASINPGAETEVKLQLDSTSKLLSESYPGVSAMMTGAHDSSLRVGGVQEKADEIANHVRPLLTLVTKKITETCLGSSTEQAANLALINGTSGSTDKATPTAK
jgi:hypothetical protein